MNKVREIQDQMNAKQRELEKQVLEEKRKNIDLDAKTKENAMMQRIKDMEQTQVIADLKQRLSSHEIKHEETLAAKKLIQSGSEPSDAKEFGLVATHTARDPLVDQCMCLFLPCV